EAVRQLAENPVAYGPLPPGFDRLDEPGFCVMFGPAPDMNMVQRIRLEDQQVPDALDRIRALARGRGRTRVSWWVGDSASPDDLAQRLLSLGLKWAVMPISEPLYGALALVEPPKPSSRQLALARRIGSFEEFVAAGEITHEAFGHTEEQ